MKAHCKILGYMLVTEILTLFIHLTLSVFTGTAFRVISSICTVGILIALMVQAGYSTATADKKLRKPEEGTGKLVRTLMLGITASVPMVICWVFLLLEKCGVFSDGYYRFYKLLCAPFLQICNLFSADVTAAALSWGGVITLGLLSLIPAAAVIVTYGMVSSGKQLEDVMYRKS